MTFAQPVNCIFSDTETLIRCLRCRVLQSVMLTRPEHLRKDKAKAKAKAIPVGNEAGTVPARTAMGERGS